MHKILVTWKYFGLGDSDENIKKLFQKHNCTGEIKPLAEAMERLAEFEGIIVGTDKITPEILDKCKKLKVIMKYGVGLDNIDLEEAKRRKIEVFNLPGINSDAVAELIVGLILALARKIVMSDKLLKKGDWKPQLGMSMQGKILGIIGTGAVGLALVKMVSGLRMKVIGYDINPNKYFVELGGQYMDKDDVIRKVDFLSVNIPLNNSTFHFIGARELQLMKKTSYIINTSRGAVIDEQALYNSLVNKEIAGAAVDVFEAEPPMESPLIKLDNVITTPHLAAFTYETFRKMDEESVAKLSTAFND